MVLFKAWQAVQLCLTEHNSAPGTVCKPPTTCIHTHSLETAPRWHINFQCVTRGQLCSQRAEAEVPREKQTTPISNSQCSPVRKKIFHTFPKISECDRLHHTHTNIHSVALSINTSIQSAARWECCGIYLRLKPVPDKAVLKTYNCCFFVKLKTFLKIETYSLSLQLSANFIVQT